MIVPDCTQSGYTSLIFHDSSGDAPVLLKETCLQNILLIYKEFASANMLCGKCIAAQSAKWGDIYIKHIYNCQCVLFDFPVIYQLLATKSMFLWLRIRNSMCLVKDRERSWPQLNTEKVYIYFFHIKQKPWSFQPQPSVLVYLDVNAGVWYQCPVLCTLDHQHWPPVTALVYKNVTLSLLGKENICIQHNPGSKKSFLSNAFVHTSTQISHM